MGVRAIRQAPDDDTPIVQVNVGGTLSNGRVVGGTDLAGVLHYSYTSDVITVTDTAAIDIANADGQYSSTVAPGSRLILSMADPNVNYGASTPRLVGLVVTRRMSSKGGEKTQIQGADQGWYLERCDAPLFMNLEKSRSLVAFINAMLRGKNGEDFGWGFYESDGSLKLSQDSLSNDAIFRRLNQGRAGVERSAEIAAIRGSRGPGAANDPFIPPLQAGPGTKIAQLIVDYCRRAKLLVNVTSLGYLQLFKPDYSQPVSYRFDYHPRRADGTPDPRNNCLDVSVDESTDGVPTDVVFVSQNAWFKGVVTKDNPNVDKIKRRYTNTGAAPHYMRATVGDDQQLNGTMVANRALWYFQRQLFDANSITVEAFGHSQGGLFFANNTLASLNDTVHGKVGNYYVSACRYVRDGGGTRTTLTLKVANLLAA
jgi:prophage tail gpP-like protein